MQEIDKETQDWLDLFFSPYTKELANQLYIANPNIIDQNIYGQIKNIYSTEHFEGRTYININIDPNNFTESELDYIIYNIIKWKNISQINFIVRKYKANLQKICEWSMYSSKHSKDIVFGMNIDLPLGCHIPLKHCVSVDDIMNLIVKKLY